MTDSSRTLRLLLLLFTSTLTLLSSECPSHASANPRARSDLPDMLVRQAQPSRNVGNDAACLFCLSELFDQHSKIHGGYQLSRNGLYAEPRMQSKTKTRLRVSAESRPEIGAAFQAARKKLGLTQAALAATLGSSQGAITRWERGIDAPPSNALLVMADLVPDEEKGRWQAWAGVRPTPVSPRAPRSIPVLHDSAAAGTPRAIDEREIDYHLELPAALLPVGGKLSGIKVSGDSMSPILEDGYIAIVDTTRRDPQKLADRMVLAREGEAVTIKWLRKQGDIYVLVPQNSQHPIRVMTEAGDFGLQGEVIKWIGEPPLPRK